MACTAAVCTKRSHKCDRDQFIVESFCRRPADSEKATEKTTEKATEKAADEATEKTTEKATDNKAAAKTVLSPNSHPR